MTTAEHLAGAFIGLIVLSLAFLFAGLIFLFLEEELKNHPGAHNLRNLRLTSFAIAAVLAFLSLAYPGAVILNGAFQ